jgi:thymidylate synthase
LIYDLKNEYGQTSWEWAKQSLIKDKDSRQAIIRFNRPVHEFAENKDFVCTLTGTFHIRNNKLHFSVTMRSQDIIRGTTFDIPYFTLLQQAMLADLKEFYPELTLGDYTHTMQSAHVYEEHFELVNNMIKAGCKQDKLPILKNNPFKSKDIDALIRGDWKGSNHFYKWINDNK